MKISQERRDDLAKMGVRKCFGFGLMEAAEIHNNIVCLAADLSGTCKTEQFREKYPKRFVNVGIAEQNMVGIAAGLASCGKIAYCASFASFLSMRACEQVRTDVAYMNANVKLIAHDAGCTVGTQGYTHYAIEDLGIMRSIPNITVVSPSDGLCIAKMTEAIAEHYGPVYMRLTGVKTPIVYETDFDLEIGKAIELLSGTDITIIATGSCVYHALQAGKQLAKEGISAKVLDMHTIKPLDEEAVKHAAEQTDLLVTVEEHGIVGGLGSAVSEVIAGLGLSTKVLKLGLPNIFGPVADYTDQMERYGLDAKGIVNQVKAQLK